MYETTGRDALARDTSLLVLTVKRDNVFLLLCSVSLRKVFSMALGILDILDFKLREKIVNLQRG